MKNNSKSIIHRKKSLNTKKEVKITDVDQINYQVLSKEESFDSDSKIIIKNMDNVEVGQDVIRDKPVIQQSLQSNIDLRNVNEPSKATVLPSLSTINVPIHSITPVNLVDPLKEILDQKDQEYRDNHLVYDIPNSNNIISYANKHDFSLLPSLPTYPSNILPSQQNESPVISNHYIQQYQNMYNGNYSNRSNSLIPCHPHEIPYYQYNNQRNVEYPTTLYPNIPYPVSAIPVPYVYPYNAGIFPVIQTGLNNTNHSQVLFSDVLPASNIQDSQNLPANHSLCSSQNIKRSSVKRRVKSRAGPYSISNRTRDKMAYATNILSQSQCLNVVNVSGNNGELMTTTADISDFQDYSSNREASVSAADYANKLLNGSIDKNIFNNDEPCETSRLSRNEHTFSSHNFKPFQGSQSNTTNLVSSQHDLGDGNVHREAECEDSQFSGLLFVDGANVNKHTKKEKKQIVKKSICNSNKQSDTFSNSASSPKKTVFASPTVNTSVQAKQQPSSQDSGSKLSFLDFGDDGNFSNFDGSVDLQLISGLLNENSFM